jgi:hypothetical protein
MSDKYIFGNYLSKERLFLIFANAIEKAFQEIKVGRIGHLIIYNKKLPIKKSWLNLWGIIKSEIERQELQYRLEIQFNAEEEVEHENM